MVFRLGIFAVLFVGMIAIAIFGYSILNQSKQTVQVAPPATEQILVAATLLQGGSLLQPADITSAPVLVSALPPGADLDTPENRSALIGSMVRTSITQGTPILDDSIIHPGDHGFLAAVLAPGMRAVTVGVDVVSGSDGLIWPGDSVDVLLTQTIFGAPSDKSIASEVVLSDVRVIATGQELIKTGTQGTGNNQNAGPSQTVTLEVTPDQAARCLVATNLGRLSLIVHSAQLETGKTVESNKPVQPVWAGDVSPALSNLRPVAPVVSTVHVFQGTPDGTDYNF
jgi:pilus assembly protein CpaB